MSNLDIKEKRKSLGITQQELANKLGVNRRTIINYENGGSIPDSQVKLLHIIFSQEEKEKSAADSLEVKNVSEYLVNRNGNTFYEESGKLYVEARLVPVKAFGSYLSDFQDYDYEALETRKFPVDHFGRGNYLCFEVEGESMNGGGLYDAPAGAELLCRELGRQHWKDGFRDSQYGWVIVHKDTVLYKDIKSLDKETGDIVCSSRSGLPQHPDFTINLNDVRQIWKVIKRSF